MWHDDHQLQRKKKEDRVRDICEKIFEYYGVTEGAEVI